MYKWSAFSNRAFCGQIKANGFLLQFHFGQNCIAYMSIYNEIDRNIYVYNIYEVRRVCIYSKTTATATRLQSPYYCK